MPAFVDLTGQTFGRWTALYYMPRAGNRMAKWFCRCSCGNERATQRADLISGRSRSCGCLNAELASQRARKDISGQRYGRAFAILPIGLTRRQSVIWECLCDCGNIFKTTTCQLASGKTQSCGCFRRETASRNSLLDISGRSFGWLTALERGPDTPNGRVRWWCLCKCGQRTLRLSGSLVIGAVISCGCARFRGPLAPPLLSAVMRLQTSARAHTRRTRKTKAGGSHTAEQITALYQRQKGKCAEPTCRVRLNGRYHKDHIMPVALGGGSEIGNIQLLCEPCNLAKRAKHPIDWAQQMGRLL